jgi:hypothetical protein
MGDCWKDRILTLGGFFQLVNEFISGRRRGEEIISLAQLAIRSRGGAGPVIRSLGEGWCRFIPSGDVGFLSVGLISPPKLAERRGVIGVYSHGDFTLPE